MIFRLSRHKIIFRAYTLMALVLCPLLILWFYIFHWHSMPVYKIASFDTDLSRTRTILYWTKMFNNDNFYFGTGDIFANCPVSNCHATNDRNRQNLENYDAVLFHGPDLNIRDLPDVRSPHQRYIFVNQESPVSHPLRNPKLFRNFFNWTMTYRRDSNVLRPYGLVRDIVTNKIIPLNVSVIWKDVREAKTSEKIRGALKSKTKQIAWFVSNCRTASERERYVERLKRYINVDVYGTCGSLTCDYKSEHKCREMVNRKYYFYLAFENSLCRDYITEKVFKFMEYNVVPVIYGDADYANILPPDSYINVMDFRSPEELAEYLWNLSHDPDRYLGFFKWKDYYRIETHPPYYTQCELCRKLHEEIQLEEVVEDLYEWWEKDQCKWFDGKRLGII